MLKYYCGGHTKSRIPINSLSLLTLIFVISLIHPILSQQNLQQNPPVKLLSSVDQLISLLSHDDPSYPTQLFFKNIPTDQKILTVSDKIQLAIQQNLEWLQGDRMYVIRGSSLVMLGLGQQQQQKRVNIGVHQQQSPLNQPSHNTPLDQYDLNSHCVLSMLVRPSHTIYTLTRLSIQSNPNSPFQLYVHQVTGQNRDKLTLVRRLIFGGYGGRGGLVLTEEGKIVVVMIRAAGGRVGYREGQQEEQEELGAEKKVQDLDNDQLFTNTTNSSTNRDTGLKARNNQNNQGSKQKPIDAQQGQSSQSLYSSFTKTQLWYVPLISKSSNNITQNWFSLTIWIPNYSPFGDCGKVITVKLRDNSLVFAGKNGVYVTQQQYGNYPQKNSSNSNPNNPNNTNNPKTHSQLIQIPYFDGTVTTFNLPGTIIPQVLPKQIDNTLCLLLANKDSYIAITIQNQGQLKSNVSQLPNLLVKDSKLTESMQDQSIPKYKILNSLWINNILILTTSDSKLHRIEYQLTEIEHISYQLNGIYPIIIYGGKGRIWLIGQFASAMRIFAMTDRTIRSGCEEWIPNGGVKGQCQIGQNEIILESDFSTDLFIPGPSLQAYYSPEPNIVFIPALDPQELIFNGVVTLILDPTKQQITVAAIVNHYDSDQASYLLSSIQKVFQSSNQRQYFLKSQCAVTEMIGHSYSFRQGRYFSVGCNKEIAKYYQGWQTEL